MKKSFPALLAVLVCAMILSGCYGPFRLTKKVYQWNGTVGDKWVNEAVFLVFNILPVYGLTVFGDAVIFNSIEFWTGNNVLAAKPEKRSTIITRGDKQAVVTVADAEQKMRIDLFDNYRPTDHFTVVRTDNGMTVAKNAQGEIIASAESAEDGSLVMK